MRLGVLYLHRKYNETDSVTDDGTALCRLHASNDIEAMNVSDKDVGHE